ncbi:glutathione-S-transferase theta, GST [Dissoconium aciculare CBS 342.82]|uniref:Glutathione-S-transferase theta, GST n=1 Tax=Dissoconium aciculare CBS 342.82 TaxID=1314786 RepID=A0A6J3M5F3_9PEZI|nr:glutathione-S-transferase theta, GST [Dissoconium aciculare CBS 342.82]KAF1823291.1 glutathione-S-transferase theta, GST [Dissoconium aciculare CBS 342.82]
MATPKFVLYGYDDNPRTLIVKIVAASAGISLKQSLVVPRMGVNKTSYMERFPLSQGKIPAIQGPGIMLTETIAICHYFAKIQPEAHLLGSSESLDQEALVLSFVSFANQELLQTLARWFLPLIPGLKDPAPYDYDAIEKGKQDSIRLLNTLEGVLSDKKWLVGDVPTLADIFVAVVVSRGLQWVLGREWRVTHPSIMRHFEAVTSLDAVTGLNHNFKLIEVEIPNKR